MSLISDPEFLHFNSRANRQRARFLRIRSIRRSVEDTLNKSLTRFLIPIADRELVLAELDEMTINDTTLFGDLDGRGPNHQNASYWHRSDLYDSFIGNLAEGRPARF